MAGKVRKKSVKKRKKEKVKKLLDKEKLTELKEKSGLKEITEEAEKEDLEDINDENFTEFLQQPVGSSAPVLEKVASVEDIRNLEQEFATIRALGSREKKEDTGTDYITNRTNYLSISDRDTTRQRERDEPQYNEHSHDYNTMFQEDKEREMTRTIIGKGDMPQENVERENRFEIERQAFVKMDKDTKKYTEVRS